MFGEDKARKRRTDSYIGTYWQREEWATERKTERNEERGIKRGRGRENEEK